MLTQGKRFVRERVPARLLVTARSMQGAVTSPESSLTADVGEGCCAGSVIRPLRRDDWASWGAAMRANYDRMRPWWGLPEDAEVATDRVAFEHHFQEWDARRRRGTGLCLAFVGPQGVLGELQFWHLSPGGLTTEMGFWLSPAGGTSLRHTGAALAHPLDRMFGAVGVRRIDAPVAVANSLPRGFLRRFGFEIEATIPKWRELHGDLVDYDLFALTPERWAQARPKVEALFGPWSSVDPT